MNTPTWRIAANNKTDRLALQAFTCTTPKGRTGHPRPWEWDVQAAIRARLIADTNRHQYLDQRLLLAEDDQGLAAVAAHARMKDWPGELNIPPGVPVRLMVIIAVADRHRHAGGSIADAAMTEVLYDIFDREPAAERIVVIAKIDHRNRASEHLARRNGLELAVPGTDDDPLGWWYLNLHRSDD